MTLFVLALCVAVVLVPLALVLRGPGAARGRRESAMALHRAQLDELARDLADGRIAAPEHASAVLEVQRRLLAADAEPAEAPAGAARRPLLATLIAVPLLAAGLYALDGHPFLPAAPLADRPRDAPAGEADAEALVATLRDRLLGLDQHSEMARQGYVLLGNAEDSLGHLPQAAAAWRRAVAIRFDPGLAALVAEAQTRLEGHVSTDSAALFRRALAAAPGDAPWRKLAEQRLTEAGG